jgi:hypothetical protein
MYEVHWTLLPISTAAASLEVKKIIAAYFIDGVRTDTSEP